jgi:ADP-ribosylglycohydrolase
MAGMKPAGQSLVGLEDRITGALLGLHAGDCLGATREFAGPDPSRSHREITGGGPFGWEPGEPTDDTGLAAVVLRAYERGFSLHAVAEGMLEWYRGGPKDVGGATSGAIQRFARSGDPLRSGAGPGQRGNGSLMRCLPTALARPDAGRRAAESRSISAITHADPVCVEACAAYNDVAAALLEEADPSRAVAVALQACRDGEVADALRLGPSLDLSALASQGDPAVPYGNRGYVLDSLTLAVAGLLDPRCFEEVLVDVVSLGGDADTTGAVAGGLVGARDGAAAIPSRWLERLWQRDEFERAASWLVPLRAAAPDPADEDPAEEVPT